MAAGSESYEAPALAVLGSVEELTMGTKGTPNDGSKAAPGSTPAPT